MNDQEEELLISKILRDIGVSQEEVRAQQKERIAIFDQILKMPSQGFKRLALDGAATAGAFGDWESAFLICDRLLKEGDKSYSTKLWHVRCLVELERYSEALAQNSYDDWPKQLKIHACFLTATCYQKLKMQQQATQCFLEVKKLNPNYPGLPELIDD